MTTATPGHRLLLVHAHPDDEVISTGAVMAHYAARGAGVTLVTCTSGEEGEVLVPQLAHLAADHDDALGPVRRQELAGAVAALGVTDSRLLGEPGRYRDSGMMGLPSNDKPGTFWRADLLAAASDLVAVLREVRPQVLITYDQDGAYGHPDHIQAHRVAMYAAQLAAVATFRPDLGPAWEVLKIYWTCTPRSYMLAAIEAGRAQDDNFFQDMDPDQLPAFVVDDDVVTTAVDASDQFAAKLAAMRAHRTQIVVDGPFFALSNNMGERAWGTETFRLAVGRPAGPFDADGRETDLFAGIPADPA